MYDEALIRMAVRDILEDAGATVLDVGNGADALVALSSDPDIDLLFTDVVMPRMNGLVLATEARTLRPAIRIVFTTGHSPDEIPAGYKVIRKPWDAAEIAGLVSH